eukprot:9717911-Alexandrium_andersonii.AAC.1
MATPNLPLSPRAEAAGLTAGCLPMQRSEDSRLGRECPAELRQAQQQLRPRWPVAQMPLDRLAAAARGQLSAARLRAAG